MQGGMAINEDQLVESISATVGLNNYLDRKPSTLSGGQCQRVALARAMVKKPTVFLMDEPLSNLDAKLRGQMRIELIELHKKLGTTFVNGCSYGFGIISWAPISQGVDNIEHS